MSCFCFEGLISSKTSGLPPPEWCAQSEGKNRWGGGGVSLECSTPRLVHSTHNYYPSFSLQDVLNMQEAEYHTQRPNLY